MPDKEHVPQPPGKDNIWSSITSIARVRPSRGLTGKITALHVVAIIALIILVIAGTFFFHWLPLVGILVLLYLVSSGCNRMDKIAKTNPLEALEGYERVQMEFTQLAFKHGKVPDNMPLLTSPSNLLEPPKIEGGTNPVIVLNAQIQKHDEPEQEPPIDAGSLGETTS